MLDSFIGDDEFSAEARRWQQLYLSDQITHRRFDAERWRIMALRKRARLQRAGAAAMASLAGLPDAAGRSGGR